MAELWVTTRTYREPCNCRDWKGPQQQQHKPSCPSVINTDSVITLSLKVPANDYLWRIWAGR